MDDIDKAAAVISDFQDAAIPAGFQVKIVKKSHCDINIRVNEEPPCFHNRIGNASWSVVERGDGTFNGIGCASYPRRT